MLPLKDAPILGCKWIYKTKSHSNDVIISHKARLVAQGNKQEYGVNKFDIFNPIEKCDLIT